jgi:hypothetical protein
MPAHFKGGRFTFSLIGDLSLGTTSTSSSYGANGFFATASPSPGLTPSPAPGSIAAQTQSQLGAGATAEISRRSATTFLDLRVPIFLSSEGKSEIGFSSLLYSTPKYSVGYGPQIFNALGQLQVGQTQRGFQFILPAGNGQATYYEGPAIGVDGETDRVLGVLLQQVHGTKFYEAGFTWGTGAETGDVKTLLFGAASVYRYVDFTGEGAYQTHTGGAGPDGGGLAAQIRLDDTVNAGGCSSTVRVLPDNFLVFGGGEVPGDRYFDIGCHATKIPVFADTSWERTSSSGIQSDQAIQSFGYTPELRFGGVSLSVQHQNGTSGGTPTSSSGVSASFSTTLFRTSAMVGAQAQRTVNGAQTDDTHSILASLQRQFGSFNLGVNGQVQTQSQVGAAGPLSTASPSPLGTPLLGTQRGIGASISRTWRKTTVQIGETITHTQTDSSDATQRTPLINLSRQISPALTVQTSIGYQILTDQLNPAANGKTRVFAISLSAPFGYGNGLVTGRIDPNLPATIVGRVVISAVSAAGAGPVLNIGTLGGSGGIGNVVVTLDGTTAQRTDLTGGFQFAFVSAGQHTISISTSTIPRGFTAASPVQTLLLKGGQEAQVTFPVSTLGGILGHVYGSESEGIPVPLSDVKLQIDGGAYAQTDLSGQYGFGGLTPGVHHVTVIPQTVPASADFAPEDLKGQVTVTNGTYATLDFHARVLGSIAGQVIFAKDMTGEQAGGVPNAYVVAEPGEHAAIDEDDGSFVIDNLPAGDYTVSVDPESIDSSLGASPDTVNVHLDPGEHYKGILFTVGHEEKKVVFTLLGGSATPAPTTPKVRLREYRLPPRGSTEVTIDAAASETGVAVTAFGKKVDLTYDKGRSTWIGEIQVPLNAKTGSFPVVGSAGKGSPIAASLEVDPKLPLVIVDFTPRDAGQGQTVTVRARFLVDVRPGDKITWQDGTETVLGKPITGRVFTFHKRLTLLPLHGLLLTQAGSLPIELL